MDMGLMQWYGSIYPMTCGHGMVPACSCGSQTDGWSEDLVESSTRSNPGICWHDPNSSIPTDFTMIECVTSITLGSATLPETVPSAKLPFASSQVGSILLAHPMSCIFQPDLDRAVIVIDEVHPGHLRGAAAGTLGVILPGLLGFIWGFPIPPKWMVYNGTPY